MKNENFTFASIMLMILAVIMVGLALIFTQFTEFKSISPIRVILPTPPDQMVQVKVANGPVAYSPPLILDAPDEIREEVMLGYKIMNNTEQFLPGLENGRMDCSDCHFMGGITQGGLNGGISLVGVSAVYPKTDTDQNLTIDLVDRTNICITQSLNAKPLDGQSEVMSALLTYFKWISKGIPIYSDIPWLGMPGLVNSRSAELVAGEKIFAQYCAGCHGSQGNDGDAPPLWGDASFSNQAEMTDVFKLASFVRLNMPRTDPILTPDQALDVAIFINNQPRPQGQPHPLGY